VITCILFFQTDAPVFASDLKDSNTPKNGVPRALLSKSGGSVTVRKEGKSIRLWATKSTLEEILQKVADQYSVILKCYCQDPRIRQEKKASLTISADSMRGLMERLFSKEHRFTLLNREGNPSEDVQELSILNVYSKECPDAGEAVGVFIAEKTHPLLGKSPGEISIEQLRVVLKREGPASRRRAAEILGRRDDAEAIPCAKEALQDDNARVMLAAANALMRLGKKHGSETVEGALYQRFLERPYGDILLALSQLNSDKIWPLIGGLMDQPGESDRVILTRALFLRNDRRAIPYLAKIAFTGGIENSGQAIYVIGKLGGQEAATVLMRLLKEGDPLRQARAAQAVHFLAKNEGAPLYAEVEKIARQ
jgi:hypothetical protein